jgi:hypothetical protein
VASASASGTAAPIGAPQWRQKLAGFLLGRWQAGHWAASSKEFSTLQSLPTAEITARIPPMQRIAVPGIGHPAE